MYRDVYRTISGIVSERALFPIIRDWGATRAAGTKRDETSSTKSRLSIQVAAVSSALVDAQSPSSDDCLGGGLGQQNE